MLQMRMGAAACALNGILYVTGGRGDNHILNTIEKYNPVENSWTEVN